MVKSSPTDRRKQNAELLPPPSTPHPIAPASLTNGSSCVTITTISSLHLLTLARCALDDVIHAKNHLRRLRRGHKHLQGSLHKESGKERGTVKYFLSRCVRRIPWSLNAHGNAQAACWGSRGCVPKAKTQPVALHCNTQGLLPGSTGLRCQVSLPFFHYISFHFFVCLSSSRCAPDTITCVETQRKKASYDITTIVHHDI